MCIDPHHRLTYTSLRLRVDKSFQSPIRARPFLPVSLNPLALFNLRESPYFQDTLQASGRYSLSTFVGRQDTADLMLRKILMSPGGTRQTIRGQPGVGKSTLAQYIKAEAATQFDLLAVSATSSLGSATDTDQVAAQILRAIVEALLLGAKVRGVDVSDTPAIRDASYLARLFQFPTNVGGELSTVGFGSDGGMSHVPLAPIAAKPSIVLPWLLPELMQVATQVLHAKGILLHLDYLNDLPLATAERAARILRDLRDTALLLEGYHWLVVGTENTVGTIVDGVEQVRTVFHRPRALLPLAPAELAALLDTRYEVLRADPTVPFLRPVEPDAVDALYRAFNGNLRATFGALDAALSNLLGTSSNGPEAALTLTDMAPFLADRARVTANEQLNERGAEDLMTIVHTFGNVPFTRAMVREQILHVKHDPSVRSYLALLLRFGYIRAHPEPQPTGGRPAAQYIITDTARLVGGVSFN